MAENFEQRINLSDDGRVHSVVSHLSDVSIDEVARDTLNRRKAVLEQELSSIGVILTRTRVSKSVPNPSVNLRSTRERRLSSRGATSQPDPHAIFRLLLLFVTVFPAFSSR